MLEIKNVTKFFGTKRILNNISLQVHQGKALVLLGKSGVGKSTLLRILNNLETFQSGTITLNQKKLDPQRVVQEHSVGMVFQQWNLFSLMNVITNITLPLEKVLGMSPTEATQVATTLLAQYGLADKALMPIKKLSGGQKQRLAIARAIAMKPRVICFDEPTSALDPYLTNSVAQSIRELVESGYLVLVSTHDTELIKTLHCTIALMDNGEIIETVDADVYKNSPEKFPALQRFISGNAA